MTVESTLRIRYPARPTRSLAPQEEEAVRALSTRVRIGKAHADVTQRRRAQQRIRYGMRQYVEVGVAFETKFAGDDATGSTCV